MVSRPTLMLGARGRFEREAKVLPSLNHPHIAGLYGMEQADGRHFLIMELVEGETLAERLQRGPLPVEDGLRIAQQIAEGLDAAHGSWFQELRAKVPTGR